LDQNVQAPAFHLGPLAVGRRRELDQLGHGVWHVAVTFALS
jgi:hypothetical protein